MRSKTKSGCWLFPRTVFFLRSREIEHIGRYRRGKEKPRGELLLKYGADIFGFFLVVLLGFLPLFIVHWADRRPDKRTAPPRVWHVLGALKTLFFIEWAEWLSSIRLW